MPGIVQQPGVESCFVTLLFNDSHKKESIRSHFETNRVVVVLLHEKSTALAGSKTQPTVPMHRHEGAELQERGAIEVGLPGVFFVAFVSDILRRFIRNH